MKKLVLYLISNIMLIFASTLVLDAQNSLEENAVIREQLDAMFSNLDKTKVPTGLLLDYAVNLVDLSEYVGNITEDNCVTLSVFDNILRTIRSSAVLTEPYGDVLPIIDEFSSPILSQEVNVGFALYNINYIVADALNTHKLRYNTNTKKVSDYYINGVWQNPYEQATVFAFTPSSNISNSRNVTYNFSLSYAFTNVTIVKLFFDAGDGVGYREVQPNSSVNVIYDSTCDKELKLKVQMSDGSIVESHSVMCVFEIDSTGLMAETTPTGSFKDSLLLDPTIKATVTYYSSSSDGMIRRPFIHVEGFDPLELNELLNGNTDDYGFTSHASNYKEFNLQGKYDFIYVDWHNSTADLRKNAELLIQIIDEINERKALSGSTEKNVLYGHSMGGLIARYALMIMERNGHPHQVKAYISHDSPHLGANVPLGALYFIYQALSMIRGDSDVHNLIDYVTADLLSKGESKLYNLLHSDAVRQMLVNYVTPYGELSNVMHEMWMEEIDALGFPHGDEGAEIENLSIVNGGEYDFSQDYIDGKYLGRINASCHTRYLTELISTILYIMKLPYTIIGNIDLGRLIEIFMFPGASNLTLSGYISPLTSSNLGNKISELRLDFTKYFLWLVPIEYNLFSSIKYAPSSSLCYDEFPGSYYDTKPFSDYAASGDNDWISFDYDFDLAPKIIFIPVASALCIRSFLPLGASEYMRNYYINPPTPGVETPFDSYYLRNLAKSHTNIDNNIYDWLDLQIDMSIVGPKVVHSDTTYAISGYSGSVQWSTSDNSIARIDNDGNLTVVGNGFVDVIAETYMGGQLYRESKTIMVSFPDLVITKSFIVGTGYKFVANALNASEQDQLDDMMESYNLEYEWTRIDGYGNRETIRTTSNVYEFLPYTDSSTSISVRIVDASDNKGPLYTMVYDQQCPFFVNFKYVLVSSKGQARYVAYNYAALIYPYMDFGVQYLFNVYSPTDNTNLVPYKYLKGPSCFLQYHSGDGVAYFEGTSGGAYMWTFDLFNSRWFLNKLDAEKEKAINGNAQIGDMVDMELIICNTEYEPLQRIPFAIIHSDEW